MRRLPIIAVFIVLVIVIKVMSGGPAPPPLKTSCTTPAFALSTYQAQRNHVVQWAATGPPSMTFTITIGVADYTRAASGRLTPVPEPAVGVHEMRSTLPQQFGSDCKAHGAFGLSVDPGRYPVRMFSFTGATPHTTAAQVAAEKTVTVSG
jgi:hypothetical protein